MKTVSIASASDKWCPHAPTPGSSILQSPKSAPRPHPPRTSHHTPLLGAPSPRRSPSSRRRRPLAPCSSAPGLCTRCSICWECLSTHRRPDKFPPILPGSASTCCPPENFHSPFPFPFPQELTPPCLTQISCGTSRQTVA